jgi:hypothetical protein
MKTEMILTFTDHFRPFSSLLTGTVPIEFQDISAVCFLEKNASSCDHSNPEHVVGSMTSKEALRM